MEKVTRQKDHQAGVGGGCSVPLHSVIVAMGGKSLVCLMRFQGVIAFCLGFFHSCCMGPGGGGGAQGGTAKVEQVYEIQGADVC